MAQKKRQATRKAKKARPGAPSRLGRAKTGELKPGASRTRADKPVRRGGNVPAPKAEKKPLQPEAPAPDEGLYQGLADVQSADAPTRPAPGSSSALRRDEQAERPAPVQPSARYKRFSTVQKTLLVSIVLVTAMLLYGLLEPSLGPAADVKQKSAGKMPPTEGPSTQTQELADAAAEVADATRKTSSAIREEGPEPGASVGQASTVQPLSLKLADALYLQEDFDSAYDAYDQLCENLPSGPHEEVLKDFLQLKMALCKKKAGETESANRLFRKTVRSRFPVLRIVATYELALAEMQKKQYLRARTRAYQTIALVEVVDYNRAWALSLERDCHFLAAESLTRSVVSLSDADKDLPPQLWSGCSEVDPFANLSEAQLFSFLNSGSEQLNSALLGPHIQQIESLGAMPRWSVISHSAPVEELLARFAGNAGVDIQWTCDSVRSPQAKAEAIRKRPVSLYLSAATAQEFATVAAGCVGLLARLDDKGTAEIFDPSEYSSLSQYVDLLSQEAVALWQKYMLTSGGEQRIGNAHFALGLLQAQAGHLTEAIAEYKLVANRFSQTHLAPYALLHSSKLKGRLRDYLGARKDLKQLIEQHPDTELSDQASLCLAEATMKAKLYDEAARLYCKVHSLDLSEDLQIASALGAGKGFYESGDYQAAAKWLTRYISIARDRTSKDFFSACFLLGKASLALGKAQQACDAFRYALMGRLSRQEYFETVSALVEAHLQQGQFVAALEVLDRTDSWQLSQKEFVQILLLKTGILRSMGLVDKAIAIVGDRAQYMLDAQLKANICRELAKCFIATGDLERARKNLAEVLVLAEPGPLAHQVAYELAEVCLKLDQYAQTISICSQLLDSEPAPSIKQKTLDLLATAYSRQKDYNRAVLALLGKHEGEN
jgi:tetratricopeptide (TPR) repeat protein